MDRRSIRRWVKARDEAARRERAEARPCPPEVSVRAALELLDVVAALHGWPPQETEAERREDERARRAWVRLRRRLRAA